MISIFAFIFITLAATEVTSFPPFDQNGYDAYYDGGYGNGLNIINHGVFGYDELPWSFPPQYQGPIVSPITAMTSGSYPIGTPSYPGSYAAGYEPYHDFSYESYEYVNHRPQIDYSPVSHVQQPKYQPITMAPGNNLGTDHAPPHNPTGKPSDDLGTNNLKENDKPSSNTPQKPSIPNAATKQHPLFVMRVAVIDNNVAIEGPLFEKKQEATVPKDTPAVEAKKQTDTKPDEVKKQTDTKPDEVKKP